MFYRIFYLIIWKKDGSSLSSFRKKLQRIVQDEALRARLLADLGLDEE